MLLTPWAPEVMSPVNLNQWLVEAEMWVTETFAVLAAPGVDRKVPRAAAVVGGTTVAAATVGGRV